MGLYVASSLVSARRIAPFLKMSGLRSAIEIGKRPSALRIQAVEPANGGISRVQYRSLRIGFENETGAEVFIDDLFDRTYIGGMRGI